MELKKSVNRAVGIGCVGRIGISKRRRNCVSQKRSDKSVSRPSALIELFEQNYMKKLVVEGLHEKIDKTKVKSPNVYAKVQRKYFKEQGKETGIFNYAPVFKKYEIAGMDGIREYIASWMLYVQRKTRKPLSNETYFVGLNLLDRYISNECVRLQTSEETEKNENRLCDPTDENIRACYDDDDIESIDSTPRIKNNQKNCLKRITADIHNLGAACFYIASKLQDETPIELATLKLFSSNSIDPNDVLRWEKEILEKVNYSANSSTPLDFLPEFTRAYKSKNDVERVCVDQSFSVSVEETCRYICDLFSLSAESMNYSPDVIAASALLLANVVSTKALSASIKMIPSEISEFVGRDDAIKMCSAKMALVAESAVTLKRKASSGYATMDADSKHRIASNLFQNEFLIWRSLITQKRNDAN